MAYVNQIGLHQTEHGIGFKLQLRLAFLRGVSAADQGDGLGNIVHGVIPPLERGTAEGLHPFGMQDQLVA